MQETPQSNGERPRSWSDITHIHVVGGDNTIRPSRIKIPPHLLRDVVQSQDTAKQENEEAANRDQSTSRRLRMWSDITHIHVVGGDNTIRPSRIKIPPHLLRDLPQDVSTDPPAETQGDVPATS